MFQTSMQNTAVLRECMRTLQIESLTDVLGRANVTSISKMRDLDEATLTEILRKEIIVPIVTGMKTL